MKTRKDGYTLGCQALIAACVPEAADGLGRLDANETAFLQRELEQVRSKVFEVEYPDNLALQFVPIATDIEPTADVFVMKIKDHAGRARIINADAQDLPLVETSVSEKYGKVYTLGVAFQFTIFELRRAARLGIPLEADKAKAARDAIELSIDDLLATGQSTLTGQTGYDMTGFINHSEVDSNPGVMHDWIDSNCTADQMLDDLNVIAAAPALRTLQIHKPNRMIMAPELYARLNSKRVDDTSTTVLKFFLQNNPFITGIDQWNRLTGAGGSSKHRVIAYKQDQDCVEAILPIRFEVLPPQQRGMLTKYDCIARCGGTRVNRPQSMQYADIAIS